MTSEQSCPSPTPHSPVPDWPNAPSFGRRETLIRALRRLRELTPGPTNIVETGTARNGDWSGCSGDGWSTVAFGWYASETGGRAWTVDIEPGAIETCRRITAAYASSLEYVVSDSVAFLRGWGDGDDPVPIHLLYLDSLDYFDHAASEAHCLAEAQAALPWMAATCLALFDDTNAAPEGYSGKGKLAVPYLLSEGFRVEYAETGQVLLSRGAGES
ncbi:MAG: hypothetical protein WCK58_03240 [Chloroflexota bacterium]